MAGSTFKMNVSTKGSLGVREALLSVGKNAKVAHARSLRLVMRKIKTETARDVARVKGINIGPIKKHLKSFTIRQGRKLAEGRVWFGVRRGIREEASGKKGKATLKGRKFTATMPGGHVGEFVRVPAGLAGTRSSGWVGRGKSKGVGYRYKGIARPRPRSSPKNLPIVEPQIFLMPEAKPIFEDQAKTITRQHYAREYRRQVKLLGLKKPSQRR